MYQDKTLVCRDCGAEFVFTAGEQEFYAEKGFQNEPTRCKECRTARKASRANAPRESYETVCAACGKPTTVPFVPKSDRPIYCSECFAAHRHGGESRRSGKKLLRKSFFTVDFQNKETKTESSRPGLRSGVSVC